MHLLNENPDSNSKIPQILVSNDALNTEVSNICESSSDLRSEVDGPKFQEKIIKLEKRTATLKHSLKMLINSLQAFLDHKSLEPDLFSECLTNATKLPALDGNLIDSTSTLKDIVKSFSSRFDNHVKATCLLPLKKILDDEVRPVLDKLKKDFESDSHDYYAFQEKYLSIKSDMDARKKNELDMKHITKKKTFDQKRMEYYGKLDQLNDPARFSISLLPLPF